MGKEHHLLAGAALIAVLGMPLAFDGGLGPERAVAQRLEQFVLPAAAAAVLVPAAKTRTTAAPKVPERLETARLLMGGTMLFGLAAIVRRAI